MYPNSYTMLSSALKITASLRRLQTYILLPSIQNITYSFPVVETLIITYQYSKTSQLHSEWPITASSQWSECYIFIPGTPNITSSFQWLLKLHITYQFTKYYIFIPNVPQIIEYFRVQQTLQFRSKLDKSYVLFSSAINITSSKYLNIKLLILGCSESNYVFYH